MARKDKIIIICGPTAAGKTGAGIILAKHFGGEIVSADSQQVYAGMDIGTAKPSSAERAEVRHHLLDIVRPSERFDAGKFAELAARTIEDIRGRDNVPFVVGGTGLYIKALCYGLAGIPERDESYRAKLEAIKDNDGVERLYEILAEKDPQGAVSFKPRDSQRIIRALEVIHLTGSSIKGHQNGHGFANAGYETLEIGLNVERAELYERINSRVDKMIAGGLYDEVMKIIKEYGVSCQGLKAVGYKEIAALNGEKPDERTIELIKQKTRNYAKRQMTWFRANKNIRWFAPGDVDGMKAEIGAFLIS